MKRSMFILFLLIVFSFSNTGAGESKKAFKADAKKIQGAWALDNMDVGVGENRRNRADGEFMIFIMKKHYSAIRDLTEKKAPGESGPQANRSFAADAGTYEFDGKEIVVHHVLTAFPFKGTMTFKCSMEDDNTLILEPQYDKMKMPGMDIKPSSDGKMGYGDMAVKYVFKRLE